VPENKGRREKKGKIFEKIPQMLQMLRSQNPSLVKCAAAAKNRLHAKPFESKKTAVLSVLPMFVAAQTQVNVPFFAGWQYL